MIDLLEKLKIYKVKIVRVITYSLTDTLYGINLYLNIHGNIYVFKFEYDIQDISLRTFIWEIENNFDINSYSNKVFQNVRMFVLNDNNKDSEKCSFRVGISTDEELPDFFTKDFNKSFIYYVLPYIRIIPPQRNYPFIGIYIDFNGFKEILLDLTN